MMRTKGFVSTMLKGDNDNGDGDVTDASKYDMPNPDCISRDDSNLYC